MSGVSPRWEAIPPSGRVADIVAGTDLSVHSDDGVLSVIAATERALSWLRAVQLRALAAMEAGQISYAQVCVIAEETLRLPVEDVPAVEERVLAGVEGKTPGQVRRATKRAVLAVDANAAVQREEKARADRKVVVNPLPDGMAELVATLPAADAHALYNRVNDIARNTPDSRSMDQRCADALSTLARGSAGPAGTPLIQVVISESTLARHDEKPADLIGYGPITATTARDIAADGIWQALHTDKAGIATDIGRHRYRPSPALAQLIRTRDRRCRHYGCEQPAHRADIDHTTRFPDGPTTPRKPRQPLPTPPPHETPR